MVRSEVNEYAPPSASFCRFSIGAAAIASGRRPSKLTINTRLILLNEGVGVSVAVGMGVRVGVIVFVGSRIVGRRVNVAAGVSVR